jgi:RNA polymerase sigma-70 factor (ECF subfamily)
MPIVPLRVHEDAAKELADEDLVRRIGARDRLAFEEIYKRHETRIYNLCLRLLRNADEARDLAQDAFLHMLEKAASFEGRSKFSSWFHRLTINLVISHLRRQKKIVLFEDEAQEKEQTERIPAPEVQSPVDGLQLQSALDKLPEGYRVVFLLHEAYGYSHDEIAEACGCTAGNSKSQLSRARSSLRGILDT